MEKEVKDYLGDLIEQASKKLAELEPNSKEWLLLADRVDKLGKQYTEAFKVEMSMYNEAEKLRIDEEKNAKDAELNERKLELEAKKESNGIDLETRKLELENAKETREYTLESKKLDLEQKKVDYDIQSRNDTYQREGKLLYRIRPEAFVNFGATMIEMIWIAAVEREHSLATRMMNLLYKPKVL